MSLGLMITITFVFCINIVIGVCMYIDIDGIVDEMEYRGYSFSNPLSVRCIFIYWWESFSKLPINIVGESILMVLMGILFIPMISVHFLITFVAFICMCIWRVFIIIFKENKEKRMLREEKNMLREAKRKLKAQQKGRNEK